MNIIHLAVCLKVMLSEISYIRLALLLTQFPDSFVLETYKNHTESN